MSEIELVVLDDDTATSEAAAQKIAEAAAAGGHIGLSGGSGDRQDVATWFQPKAEAAVWTPAPDGPDFVSASP